MSRARETLATKAVPSCAKSVPCFLRRSHENARICIWAYANHVCSNPCGGDTIGQVARDTDIPRAKILAIEQVDMHSQTCLSSARLYRVYIWV